MSDAAELSFQDNNIFFTQTLALRPNVSVCLPNNIVTYEIVLCQQKNAFRHQEHLFLTWVLNHDIIYCDEWMHQTYLNLNPEDKYERYRYFNYH